MHVNTITKTGYKAGSKGIILQCGIWKKKVHSKLRVQGWGLREWYLTLYINSKWGNLLYSKKHCWAKTRPQKSPVFWTNPGTAWRSGILVHYMYIYTMLTFRECSSLVLCSCSFTDASWISKSLCNLCISSCCTLNNSLLIFSEIKSKNWRKNSIEKAHQQLDKYSITIYCTLRKQPGSIYTSQSTLHASIVTSRFDWTVIKHKPIFDYYQQTLIIFMFNIQLLNVLQSFLFSLRLNCLYCEFICLKLWGDFFSVNLLKPLITFL